jgi:hypothetical protein
MSEERSAGVYRAIWAGGALAALTVCVATTPELRQAIFNPSGTVPTPSGENTPVPNYALTPGATQIIEPTPVSRVGDPNYIINQMTLAPFRITSDPKGYGRQCVELEQYIEKSNTNPNGNMQDVVGAAVALGPNTGSFNDIPGPVSVYDAGDAFIGSFMTNEMPDHATFGKVYPGTTVCDSSNLILPEDY